MKNTNFDSSHNIIYLKHSSSSINEGYVEDSAKQDSLLEVIKNNTILLREKYPREQKEYFLPSSEE